MPIQTHEPWNEFLEFRPHRKRSKINLFNKKKKKENDGNVKVLSNGLA